MTPLMVGQVLAPAGGQASESDRAIVDEAHLILWVDPELDVIVLIPIEPKRSAGRIYFRTYRRMSYSSVSKQAGAMPPKLVIRDFKPRPVTTLTDEELQQRFGRKHDRSTAQLNRLKWRWSLIVGLLSGAEPERLFSPDQLQKLAREQAESIASREPQADIDPGGEGGGDLRLGTKKVGRVEKEIRAALNQYWAGGSRRGALIGFADRCGGRGKSRKAGSGQRGRPIKGFDPGDEAGRRLIVEEGSRHAEIIKWCHDTWVTNHCTTAAALRRMWTEFYSETIQQPDGSTRTELLPPEKRPTEAQFRYWGAKGSAAEAAWRRQLPQKEFERNFRSLSGSARDDVYVYGQRGAIDSSPTDLQLVRTFSRLKRIGGAHRIVLVDSCFGYIPGFYMGLEAPSSMTVLLALYNAMDPDKQGWLDDLGLDLPAEDFIPTEFSTLIADNTDARSAQVMQAAAAVGCIANHYVPKLRSDLNPVAESAHHSLHRLVDHQLAGSTYGKPKHRTERSATVRARYTPIEAIRETARAVHYHNTVEIDVWQPLRMRMKNVPPTRLHMTRELIRIGKVARLTGAIELGRKHLLPRYTGTFTESGVRLHRSGSGEKVEFIAGIAYVSAHPVIVSRLEQARRGGKRDADYFRDSFIVYPCRLRYIWYVDRLTGECIELSLKVLGMHDEDVPLLMTMHDVIDRGEDEHVKGLSSRESRQVKRAALEQQQRASNESAEAAYRDAVSRAGAEPTLADAARDKRANREDEKAEMIAGIPVPPSLLFQLSSAPAASEVPRSAGADEFIAPVPEPPRPEPSGSVSLLRQAVKRRRVVNE